MLLHQELEMLAGGAGIIAPLAGSLFHLIKSGSQLLVIAAGKLINGNPTKLNCGAVTVNFHIVSLLQGETFHELLGNGQLFVASDSPKHGRTPLIYLNIIKIVFS